MYSDTNKIDNVKDMFFHKKNTDYFSLLDLHYG